MKRDFAQLYSELGLQPDCSLDELKHAYRRRVGQLHPDRPQAEHSPEAQAQLRDIIRLYTTAVRFHRRHGQLPGMPQVPVFRREWTPRPPAPPRSGVPAEPGVPTRTQRRATIVLVLILVSLFAWAAYAPPSEPDAHAGEGPSSLVAGPVYLGADEATVAAIQGRPTHVEGGRWYYGPSWIEFTSGRVSDWNSSTMRPLDTETATPAH